MELLKRTVSGLFFFTMPTMHQRSFTNDSVTSDLFVVESNQGYDHAMNFIKPIERYRLWR